MNEELKKAMADRGYLGIQRILATCFYECSDLDKLPQEDVKKLYEEAHDCVKAAWQLGMHNQKICSVENDIKNGRQA